MPRTHRAPVAGTTQPNASILDLLAALLRASPYQGAPIGHDELRRHHLRPLAHLAGVPGLTESYSQVAILAAMHKQTLQELAAAFARASIPWTTIKGANYAWKLYPDPAHRPMSDLDLIVPDAHFGPAIVSLKTLGFRERSVTRTSRHAQTLARRPHELIDLHRSILQPWRRNGRAHDFWARSLDESSFTGSRAFCQVDLTLVHIAHMARHEFVVPLVSFIDLQRLLARLSPEEHRDLEQRLEIHHLDFAYVALQHLLTHLASQNELVAPARVRRVLPRDAELVAGKHASRKAQLSRKLALFPSDAPALLAGYCVRALGDRLLGATSRRGGVEHSFRWRR